MKIAFVEPHLELYGGIRRIMELSNRLVAMGEDVAIYHPTGKPCAWMDGRAPTRPLSTLFDCEHDVVIFNDPPDYRHVRRARARLKIFYVLCLYEREKLKKFNPKIFWPKKGRMMSLKRALQMPFLRIANATWMQQYMVEELGMDALLLIGGINRDMFRPVDVARSDNAIRILCSGDPRERKGTDVVEAAFERVKARFPNAVLDTYHGQGIPQERMAQKYCSADIFADAQWYAGWNNPVAEAMACGVPIVCTDIGAVRDFAVHDKTALLIPVDDVDAMASSLIRLIEDRALRTRLREAGLEQIGQFDWDASARKLMTIIEKRVQVTA